MSEDHLTISAMRASNTAARPQWYAAIAAANGGTFPTNTLFEIGKRWDDATDSYYANHGAWPESTKAGAISAEDWSPGMYAGTDSILATFLDSYGCSVYVPELGSWGTMLFGNAGENIIGGQLASWRISDDEPAFDVFQKTDYQTTAQGATDAGAAWYYNPTEFHTLRNDHPARVMPWSAGTGIQQAAWAAAWDRVFPVGIAGWIIPDKQNGPSIIGKNQPLALRYNYPVYVPPSMTGLDAGMLVTNTRGWTGPFQGCDGPPGSAYGSRVSTASGWQSGPCAPADWYGPNMLIGGTRRKFHLMGLNVRTKVWSILAQVPDFDNSYDDNAVMPQAFVDVPAKRIYYAENYASKESLYYADFTNGAASVTTGGLPVNMTEQDGELGFTQAHSNMPLFIGSGALAGKKLYYFKNGASRVGMIDLSTNPPTIYDLNGMGGASLPGVFAADGSTVNRWSMALDQANARVYIIVRDTTAETRTIKLWKFDIPTVPGVAANYTLVGPTTINLNGITLEATPREPYGDRNYFLSALDGIVLMNQHAGKMLALRPA